MVLQRKYLLAADLVVPNVRSIWIAPAETSVVRTLVFGGRAASTWEPVPSWDWPPNSARATETVDADGLGFGGFGVTRSGVGTLSGTGLGPDILWDFIVSWNLKNGD